MGRFRPDPRLADVPAYVPGRKAPFEPGNLAANELPFGPSETVLEALAQAATQVHRYPDPLADELRAALCSELSVPADQILVANGSDELFYLLMLAVDPATTRVACADPPYQLHHLAPRIFRIEPLFVPLVDWRHDLSAFAKAEADVAILCNPHNPTGTAMSSEEIAGFLDDAPNTFAVVDEAYIEFADDPSELSAIPLVESSSVAVIRSLSKSLGLAGLRIGYLVGPPDLVALLQKIRPPFSVNALAQAAALAALGDGAHRQKTRQHILAMRPRLVELMSSFGYQSVPSQANFVLVKVPDEAGFCDRLREEGVSVRPGSRLGIEGAVRVTVPDEKGYALLEKALAGLADRH